MTRHESRPWLAPLAILLALALVGIASLRARPPAPLGASAAQASFSATRARATLGRVLSDGTPHPVGTPENARVRQRIVAELEALGLTPKLEPATVCGRHGVCARVVNILARIEGGTARGAIMLAAHYDSVGASPGASDDGLGIAVLLEAARALRSEPPLARPVLLLFTDGEEAGLLGAEAFARGLTPRDDVFVVLNVEARGTYGPSLLFETSAGNSQLVSAFARAAQRPLASSLFHSVYQRLPNDTDLTVFKRAGLAGVNFASIGGVARYHTPLDDLAHSSASSLQHHGDNVLSLARELSRRPELSRSGDAVFFDVLSLAIVRWPKRHAALITGLSCALALLALALAIRSGAARLRDVLASAALWPLALASSALLAWLAFALLRALGQSEAWPAHPTAFVLLALALGLLPALGSSTLRRRGGAWREWATVTTWWSLFAMAVTLALPEASHLFVVPVASAGLTGLVAMRRPSTTTLSVALLAPLAAALVLWVPVLVLAYDAVGLQAPALLATLTALLATLALPAFATATPRFGKVCTLSIGLTALLALAASSLLPLHSKDSPQRLSLAFHHDADSRTSRHLAEATSGAVPDAVMHAGGFSNELVDPSPWVGGWRPLALAAPAPTLELPAPVLEQLHVSGELERRTVRGRLRSRRGAHFVTLHFERPGSVREVRVAGERATPRPGARESSVTFFGDTSGGVEVEITCSGPLPLVLSDHTPGLPASSQHLLASRPETAVPSQVGDVTVVSRRLEL